MDKEFFYTSQGKEYVKESKVLSYLLDQHILFANTRKYLELDGEEMPATIVLFLNCNDLFGWGVADAENITCAELGDIYKACFEPDGLDKWVCIRRNMKPQRAVIENMKKAGTWDEAMENLPENAYGE